MRVRVPCWPPTSFGSKVIGTVIVLPALRWTGLARPVVRKAPEAPFVDTLTETALTVTRPAAVKTAAVFDVEPSTVSGARIAAPARGGAPLRGPKARIWPSELPT